MPPYCARFTNQPVNNIDGVNENLWRSVAKRYEILYQIGPFGDGFFNFWMNLLRLALTFVRLRTSPIQVEHLGCDETAESNEEDFLHRKHVNNKVGLSLRVRLGRRCHSGGRCGRGLVLFRLVRHVAVFSDLLLGQPPA